MRLPGVNKYLIIQKLSNSWGRGYSIRAEIGGYRMKETNYYMYSEKEAIAKYRKENGVAGLHFDRIYI